MENVFQSRPFETSYWNHFSKKSDVIDHPDLVFNSNIFHKAPSQKHLQLILNDKLNIKEHINKKHCKTKKGIGILRKLHHFIWRSALLTIIYTIFHLFTVILTMVILSKISRAMFLSQARLNHFNRMLYWQLLGSYTACWEKNLLQELVL